MKCGYPPPYYKAPSGGFLVNIGAGEAFAPVCHLLIHVFVIRGGSRSPFPGLEETGYAALSGDQRCPSTALLTSPQMWSS